MIALALRLKASYKGLLRLPCFCPLIDAASLKLSLEATSIIDTPSLTGAASFIQMLFFGELRTYN